MKRKILLIGPLPDPKGGVSIHIKRLGNLISPFLDVKYIDESSIKKNEYFNLRSLNIFIYISLILWADIVHIHSGPKILRILHLFVSKILFKKVIITFHSTPKDKNLNFLKQILNRSDKVVWVNKESSKLVELKTIYTIKEAFVPQKMEEEPALPINIQNWLMDKKANGYFIISANAWQLDFYKSVDLYGLDMCIALTNQIKKNTNKKVAFLFTVSKFSNEFTKYEQQIVNLNLDADFILSNQNISFVKVIEQSDLVLRPTITDGDALTIREALFLGVPVIASDVVVRPANTILFQNRNQNDLFLKVISTLDHLDDVKKSLKNSVINDYLQFYKELYNFEK